MKDAWFGDECNREARYIWIQEQRPLHGYVEAGGCVCRATAWSISDDALSALLPAANSVLHPTWVVLSWHSRYILRWYIPIAPLYSAFLFRRRDLYPRLPFPIFFVPFVSGFLSLLSFSIWFFCSWCLLSGSFPRVFSFFFSFFLLRQSMYPIFCFIARPATSYFIRSPWLSSACSLTFQFFRLYRTLCHPRDPISLLFWCCSFSFSFSLLRLPSSIFLVVSMLPASFVFPSLSRAITRPCNMYNVCLDEKY